MAIDINIPSQIKTFANLAAFPATGVVKTIFIATDTNKTYRWTGSAYVEISASQAAAWGTITGTLSTQTDLQTALNAKVTGNTAITGATKTKVTYDSKGLVTAGADATTADISDSLNKRYVTDANLTVIGNTSGTNTGDQTLAGLGGVPTTRTLTINGTTQDLSADRTFTISTGITIGTTAITSGTVGRVLFEGTGNVVQESANLFWDNTNGRLGVGTSTPTSAFNIVDTKTATINNQIGALNITGTYTARATASDTLISIQNSQLLVASANNQKLVGTTLRNTFTLGAFTGITTFPLEVYGITNEGLVRFKTNANGQENKVILGDWTGSGYTTKLVLARPSGGTDATTFNQGNALFTIDNIQGAIALNPYSATNVLINTITDAGFKLDVNGTARVSGQFDVISGAANFRVNNNGGYVQLGIGATPWATYNSVETYYLGSQFFFNLGANFRFAGVGQFGFTGNPFNSAILQADSTTKGFLPPRMTTTQKNAIATPATGLMVYDTTLNLMALYNGTSWTTL